MICTSNRNTKGGSLHLDKVGGERPCVGPPSVDVHEFLEVGVEELEDEVEHGLAVLVGLLDGEELDDVEGVGEEVEEGDLAERGGRDALLVHLEAGLLERHQLARRLVLRLVHLAVGALPDLLQLLVLSHDVHRRIDRAACTGGAGGEGSGVVGGMDFEIGEQRVGKGITHRRRRDRERREKWAAMATVQRASHFHGPKLSC
jgi:hypothetical protein